MNPKKLKLYKKHIPDDKSLFILITSYAKKSTANKVLEENKGWDCSKIVKGRDNKGRFNGRWVLICYNDVGANHGTSQE